MISRKQFLEAYLLVHADMPDATDLPKFNEEMLWHLFDKPDAPEVNLEGMEPIKIQFGQPEKPKPIPSIDEQMKAIAHNGRCFGGHFDANGDVNYFMANLSYRDKLIVQDVIVQNVNLHFRKVNGLDD